MALVQLARWLAHEAIDHAATPHGWPLGDLVCPAQHMSVGLNLQEFTGFVQLALDQRAVPGPHRHVGNGVLVSRQKRTLGKAAVEHVQLALDLHRVPVDRVFDFCWCVSIEVPKPSAQKRRAAHLPEQPRQAFGALGAIQRKKGAELLGQIHQDRARLKHPNRLWSAAVHQRRDLGVGVGRDETAAELVTLLDADQPGVVLCAAVPRCQQLLKHHRHLDAVGRALRIELQRMAPDGQFFFMGRASGRAIDAGKAATAFLDMRPDLGRLVRGRVVHGEGTLLWWKLVGRAL